MTYKELIAALNAMPTERLEDDVSIFSPLDVEFYELKSVNVLAEGDSDILDPGHIYLTLVP